MERHGADNSAAAAPPPFTVEGGHYHYDDRHEHFHGGYQQQQQPPDQRLHRSFNGQQNEPPGFHLNGDPSNSLPLTGHKRPLPLSSNSAASSSSELLYFISLSLSYPRPFNCDFIFSADNVEYGGIVKLYAVGIPRTATEQDVSNNISENIFDHRRCALKFLRIISPHNFDFMSNFA